MKKVILIFSSMFLIAAGCSKKRPIANAPEGLQVSTPTPYQVISSPLTITGQARGTWFFEASFPLTLKDSSGKMISQGTAQAKSNWMTTDFVPFTSTLNFTPQPKGSTGTLELKKDNPSGLPQNDASYEIPVKF